MKTIRVNGGVNKLCGITVIYDQYTLMYNFMQFICTSQIMSEVHTIRKDEKIEQNNQRIKYRTND